MKFQFNLAGRIMTIEVTATENGERYVFPPEQDDSINEHGQLTVDELCEFVDGLTSSQRYVLTAPNWGDGVEPESRGSVVEIDSLGQWTVIPDPDPNRIDTSPAAVAASLIDREINT